MKMRSDQIVRGIILVGLLLVPMIVSSEAGILGKEETPGERFRKGIEKIRQACESRKLDPGEVCGEVSKLKPADPLATEEGRFAHSIKIPNPVSEDSGYKPEMTSQEYFDHLCKTEAGEFIYRTVENVEGIYMMRPRKEATDEELEHLYALEDPYGYTTGTSAEQAFGFIRPDGYRYVETPLLEVRVPSWKKRYRDSSLFAHPPAKAKYARYFGFDARNMKSMKMEYDRSLRSRYGFTWRGISRPHDREMGIVGGELIILELASNEVVAVRRGFIKSSNVKNLTGIWWLKGQVCPGGLGRAEHGGDNFVLKVVKPVPSKGEHYGSR